MARMTGTTWKPIDTNYTRRKTDKRRVILHVADSESTSIHGWVSNPSARASSHFYVARDGSIEQYVDTDYIAWASGEGNSDSIGIETQGRAAGPWTAEQVDALVRIIAWAHETHGVPLRLMASSKSTEQGVGWHRLGVDGKWFPALPSMLAGRGQRGGGERWSSVTGKTCPGDERIPQIPGIVAAAAENVSTRTKDPNMATLLTNQQWRDDVQGRYIVWGVHGPQCVDLMKDKAIRVHGAPKGAYGNGLDMAQGLSRLEGWTYHRIGSAPLEEGDIVSGEAGAPWHKKYGHVFEFVRENADGSWVITDQNPGPARTRTIRPSNLRGFVRPPRKALTVTEALSAVQTYTIVAGDTLGKVAKKFGVSVDQLRTWNSIRDVNLVYVGQKLVVAEPALRYRVTWNRVNLFSGPSETRFSKVGTLTKGYDDLTATGRRENGWVEVASRYMREHDTTGWVWGKGVEVIS